ncbi:MAG: hypothetical protein L6R39_005776 [Caloplaca ligustica]|nr:MAG: hypothetical protein L6R39_005776 [Caloplaca ligustica]
MYPKTLPYLALSFVFSVIVTAVSVQPPPSIVASRPVNNTQPSILFSRTPDIPSYDSESKCNTLFNDLHLHLDKGATGLTIFDKDDATKLCGDMCSLLELARVSRANSVRRYKDIHTFYPGDPFKIHRRLYCHADKAVTNVHFDEKSCTENLGRIISDCSGSGSGFGGLATDNSITYQVYAVTMKK